jgi:uncharacterized protein YndB with AHSA1/START domain
MLPGREGDRLPNRARPPERPPPVESSKAFTRRISAEGVEEPLDPILIQVTIPLPIGMIHAALLDPHRLGGWLCDEASVEPRLGGAYTLRWKGPPAFESHGTITHLTPDVDVGFHWRGPPPFVALMNEPEPKTNVYVRLQESPEGIDVTLEHSGWGGSPAWEEARSWHFHFWDERLQRFKDYLIREAYG